MKNILFLFLLSVFITGCSTSDDSSNSELFNPPSWIQGTWKNDISFGYIFTSNNVCQINFSNEICFKEMIEDYNATIPNTASVNEIVNNDTEYKFSYSVYSVTQFFHFKKLSNSAIEFYDESDNSTILDKE
jgi:hypothetical protein